MKNILWYILNKVRYCICLVLIIFIALPLVPLIIFANFSWIGILYIANEEGCSLSKAKKIYLANKDEKYTFKPSKEINSYNINKNENALKSSTSYRDATSDNNFSNVGSSSSDFHNHQTSPAYSYLSYNVYNNDNKL
jgi:hypothetical protein